MQRSGVFSPEKTPPDRHSNILYIGTHIGNQYWWEIFTKLFLSNILNHCESDVQWQIDIECSHLSILGGYEKRMKL